MKISEYVQKLKTDNEGRKKQILTALKRGPASQHELRERLHIGHDDEMICDMCFSLCCELQEEGKLKQKSGTWRLA